MGKRLAELSKGTRTKVSLLAAVSHGPDVLLLDEPTSGLDPRSRAEVLRLLKTMAHAEGRAVLFSTHNLSEVEQIADRVIVVERGRIIVNERLEELRRSAGSAWTLENYYLELVP
jgi:ABC-2 type transport system ATP-binding protein